jgi:hypothetical protein
MESSRGKIALLENPGTLVEKKIVDALHVVTSLAHKVAAQFEKLIRSKAESFQRKMPLHALSKVFTDLIYVARKHGLDTPRSILYA